MPINSKPTMKINTVLYLLSETARQHKADRQKKLIPPIFMALSSHTEEWWMEIQCRGGDSCQKVRAYRYREHN
jgi:hypothetical protein